MLDLFGTVVFAVTGALRAIEHKYDIVGIIILATVTGILGGNEGYNFGNLSTK